MTSPAAAADLPRPGRRRTRRPFALLALAGLLLVKAGVLVALLLDVRVSGDSLLSRAVQLSPEMGKFIEAMTLADFAIAGLAIVLAASAVGLVLLRRDGWLMAMVLTGLFVAADITGFFSGSVNYLWMALNIATVFYLNQAEVRAAVGVSTDPLVPGTDP